MRDLISDCKFAGNLNPLELATRDSLVVKNVLGFQRTKNDDDLISNMPTTSKNGMLYIS